jgi:hypothetical protein
MARGMAGMNAEPIEDADYDPDIESGAEAESTDPTADAMRSSERQ